MLRERLKAAAAALGDFQTRVKVGALSLLVLTALLNNLSNFAAVVRHPPQPNMEDEVARHERRLEELRGILPRRGVVGYVTDATDPNEETKRYYMTQYALAPLVVVRGAGHGLVVGDFKNPSPEVEGLAVRRDFGGGLLLLGGEGR